MPFSGKYSPGPERTGSFKPLIQTLVESLSAQRGSAYTADPDTVVDVENHAIARALWWAWETNQRAANQFDPNRVTDMLERWESIFWLSPSSAETPTDRRDALALKFGNIGRQATYGSLFTFCQDLIGSNFVDIVHTTSAEARVVWPAGGFAPTGYDPTVTFSSTVAHVLIEVAQAANQSAADFDEVLGNLVELDNILPAWVTWNWFIRNSLGNIGFLLDEPNLDQEVLGS